MNKGFWKISFSKLVPSFLKSDVKHPPKSKNFEIFPTSNSNNSKTKKSFEILKTPLNPACGDEHIGFFSFFLGPFPDLEKTVGSLNPVHFSRELLVKNEFLVFYYSYWKIIVWIKMTKQIGSKLSVIICLPVSVRNFFRLLNSYSSSPVTPVYTPLLIHR